MKTITIGTDASIDECIREGYMLLSYPEKSNLDKSKYYRIFIYAPDYLIKETEGRIKEGELILDTQITWNYMYERYLIYKKDIDSFAETNTHVNFKNPTFHDLLTLCDEVNAYCDID